MCAFVLCTRKKEMIWHFYLFDSIKSLELVVPIPLPLSWSARKAMQSTQSETTPILLTLKRPPILLDEWILTSYWRNQGTKAKKKNILDLFFLLLTTLLYQTFLFSQEWNIHWFEDRWVKFAVKTFLNGWKNILYFSDCFLSYQARSGRWLWRYLPKIGKR